MVLMYRKRQLAAKAESSKGVAEALTADYAKYYAEDIRFNFMPDEVVRSPLRSTLSTLTSLPGPRVGQVTCRVELKGSGTKNTPPSWGTLLKGCGFDEVITTNTVYYEPDSDETDTDTLTMSVYNDGVVRKMYGARGNVSFEFNANGVVYGNFTFTGIYLATTDSALLSPTYESTVPVTWKHSQIAFNFGSSYTGTVMSTMTVDMNNNVVLRPNANCTLGMAYAVITGRDPGGTMDPDTVTKATQNWSSHVTTPTTGTASWRVGTTTGNLLTFTAPAMQILGWSDTDRDGVSTDTQTFKLRTGTGGDNELVITQS